MIIEFSTSQSKESGKPKNTHTVTRKQVEEARRLYAPSWYPLEEIMRRTGFTCKDTFHRYVVNVNTRPPLSDFD